MNLVLLKKKLVEAGIRPDSYCLVGGLPNEAYTIGKTRAGWEVYYSERGLKSGLKIFACEEDACNCLLANILRDSGLMV